MPENTQASVVQFPGSRVQTGPIVLVRGPSCSTACGIFPDQGLNPYFLHWLVDSLPLNHHGNHDALLESHEKHSPTPCYQQGWSWDSEGAGPSLFLREDPTLFLNIFTYILSHWPPQGGPHTVS